MKRVTSLKFEISSTSISSINATFFSIISFSH